MGAGAVGVGGVYPAIPVIVAAVVAVFQVLDAPKRVDTRQHYPEGCADGHRPEKREGALIRARSELRAVSHLRVLIFDRKVAARALAAVLIRSENLTEVIFFYLSNRTMLPSFFIIGERKCGTSSLFRYLATHPQVIPGRLKEPNFFGRYPVAQWEARWEEYKRNFPQQQGSGKMTLLWPELDAEGQLYEEEVVFDKSAVGPWITGEASANSLSEVSPEPVQRLLPGLRLIAVLREPVARAFSHHRMYQRFQAEGRDLGFAVRDFRSDLRREMDAWPDVGRCPCLAPGMYLPHLQRWAAAFGRSALLVLRSQDLESTERAQRTLDRVGRHLGLTPHDYRAALQQRYNVAPPAAIPADIRAELEAFYAPHNRALARWLGWEEGGWKR